MSGRNIPLPWPGRPDDGPASGHWGALHADCSNCFGLCCVVPAFAASADFAITKKAEHACPNLQEDSRCAIHTQLREEGFAGCTVYDCFGAGQKVSQVTFGGADWRSSPGTARAMFGVFPVMRDLHELLWYLKEALALVPSGALAGELQRAFDDVERLSLAEPEALLTVQIPVQRAAVNLLLLRASDDARASVSQPPAAAHRLRDLRGADLIGARLHGADLRGANLRGAYLIGADLRDADLTLADVTGADLRGADLRGADLSGCLFLLQSQLDSATGDSRTRIPVGRTRPSVWPGPAGHPAPGTQPCTVS